MTEINGGKITKTWTHFEAPHVHFCVELLQRRQQPSCGQEAGGPHIREKQGEVFQGQSMRLQEVPALRGAGHEVQGVRRRVWGTGRRAQAVGFRAWAKWHILHVMLGLDTPHCLSTALQLIPLPPWQDLQLKTKLPKTHSKETHH